MSGRSPAARLGRVVDERREELFSLRARVQEWAAQRDAVAAEIDQVSRSALESAFDADVDTVTRSSEQLADLQDRLAFTRRAVDEGMARVKVAERAFLAAEADRLEAVDLPPTRAAVEAHQARTDELLALLAEHEGVFEPGRLHPMRSTALRGEVRRLELQVRLLRDMAAGRHPLDSLIPERSVIDGRFHGFTLEDLAPACVAGPDAVVSLEAFEADRVDDLAATG